MTKFSKLSQCDHLLIRTRSHILLLVTATTSRRCISARLGCGAIILKLQLPLDSHVSFRGRRRRRGVRISESCWAERTGVSSVCLSRRRGDLHNRNKREARLLFSLAVCAGHGDECCACKNSIYNTWFLFVADIWFAVNWCLRQKYM